MLCASTPLNSDKKDISALCKKVAQKKNILHLPNKYVQYSSRKIIEIEKSQQKTTTLTIVSQRLYDPGMQILRTFMQ